MNLSEFSQRINNYFDECGEDGTYPDEAGMLLALNLDREHFDRILNSGELRTSTARRLLLDARLRRESLLTRELFATDKSVTGKVFLARQASAGALSDKPREQAGPAKLEVRLLGDEDAFD